MAGELEALRKQLYEVRESVLRMQPYDMYVVMCGFRDCATFHDLDEWEQRVVEKALEYAVPCQEIMLDGINVETRGCCPLCGGKGNSYYVEGYKLPEGLRRHLVGYGRTERCPVMKIAWDHAQEQAGDAIREREDLAWVQKEVERADRREKEQLYRVDARGNPVLLDEGFLLGYEKPRAPEGLKWASQRLVDLGFEVRREGNVAICIQESEELLVLADPRREGSIGFRVYRKPIRARTRKPALRMDSASFSMQDSWKNDLKAKFRARLRTALESLGAEVTP